MKKFILYALASSALLTAASAQDPLTNSEQRFEGVNDILIENFTGRLEVIIGGDQTRISMQQGNASFQFEAMLNGETLSLAGEGVCLHRRKACLIALTASILRG